MKTPSRAEQVTGILLLLLLVALLQLNLIQAGAILLVVYIVQRIRAEKRRRDSEDIAIVDAHIKEVTRRGHD